MKERVLSGMQASGRLHLGNLVGALSNWVKLQDKYDCYYFVADWHALTTGYADPSSIKESTKDILINFIAAGLDPEKCTIFLQSRVLEHAELHLLLSMITPLGWLERVPTYKEKQQELKDRDLSTYGFLGYPLLQTADIIGDSIISIKKSSPNQRLCLLSSQRLLALTDGRCQRAMTTQYIFQIHLKTLSGK
jgi:tryptophanyl-tRNA synthetase